MNSPHVLGIVVIKFAGVEKSPPYIGDIVSRSLSSALFTLSSSGYTGFADQTSALAPGGRYPSH
jgi:hypothetical protein